MSKSFWKMWGVLGLMVGAVACSGGGGGGGGGGTDASTTGITISGTLGTSSASIQSAGDFGELAVSASDLKLYGVAFSTPPVAVSVDINSDGTFSLNFPGVADNTAISLIFQNKTSGEQVGLVKFEDTSKTDVNGNSQKSTTIPLKGSVSLGALNLSKGEVTVPVSSISSNVGSTDVSSSTAFDFSGTYTLAQYTGGSFPTGYTDPTATSCDPTANGGAGQACIPAGQTVTFVRYTGKDFNPTGCTITNGQLVGNCAVGDGTVGTTDRYVGQVWEGPSVGAGSGVQGCGYKVGVLGDEARAMGRVHITSFPTVASTPMAFGKFSFATPAGYGGTGASPYNKDWMKTGATAAAGRNYGKCGVVNKTGSDSKQYNFFVCEVSATIGGMAQTRYTAGATDGQGCFNSQNQPLRVDQSFWSGNPAGSCTYGASPVTGTQIGTCTYTGTPYTGAGSQTFTCKFMNGNFSDATMTTPDSSTWTATTPQNYIAAGAGCASAGSGSDAAILAGYQCYADAYFNNKNDWNNVTCADEFRFNWASATSSNFVYTSNSGRPKKMFMLNIASYSPDGQTFFLNDNREEKEVIFVNGKSTVCSIDRETKMIGKKISSTQLLMDLTQGGVLKTYDANCVGAQQNNSSGVAGRLKTQHFLFYANK